MNGATPSGASDPSLVRAELERASQDGGAVLATLAGRCNGDLELAQDALQDAFESAIVDWERKGIPREPLAWLRTTAWRKALDRLRRETTGRAKHDLLASLERTEPPGPTGDKSQIRDDQLKLVFCCCHPALSLDAQVALTLRAVGGLDTAAIARAFLVSEPTMAQRLVRAKRKISRAGIPFRVPSTEELPDRLAAVSGVVYLIFTAGHHVSDGESLVSSGLCDEAIRLSRLLCHLLPDEEELSGLLALMLLHHARRDARVDADGRLVRLDDQDRSLWDLGAALEGTRLVTTALRRGNPGSFQLQAAIAAVHASAGRASDTDWGQISNLYDQLVRRSDSPVIELNRCVAITMTHGPERGMAAFSELRERRPEVDSLHLAHSTHAELLVRLGRPDEAVGSYRRAMELTANPVELRFLGEQIESCATGT